VVREVPWPAAPHTKAKHDLYRRYLGKWMPIMINGAWRGDVTYAEGFAGPGVYADGSAGSPVIAFNAIRQDVRLRSNRNKNVRMLFVDKEQLCTQMLNDELLRAADPYTFDELRPLGIDVDIRTGTCEPALVELLDAHGSWNRPILAVLDTWGSGVSFDLIRRIADNPSSEVLITIQPQFFTRFAEAKNVTYGDRVFGSTQWRQVAAQPSQDKAAWLIEHYRDTVKDAGFRYVLDFELVDADSRRLYLVFGTGKTKGLQKMKEAMWEVDPALGSGYRDPRDPNQQMLDIAFDPQTGPLERLITRHLEEVPEHSSTVLQLRDFALFETIYKAAQVLPVVQDMLDRRQLVSRTGTGRYGDVVALP
jgi:three-Cys-motif partner protein